MRWIGALALATSSLACVFEPSPSSQPAVDASIDSTPDAAPLRACGTAGAFRTSFEAGDEAMFSTFFGTTLAFDGAFELTSSTELSGVISNHAISLEDSPLTARVLGPVSGQGVARFLVLRLDLSGAGFEITDSSIRGFTLDSLGNTARGETEPFGAEEERLVRLTESGGRIVLESSVDGGPFVELFSDIDRGSAGAYILFDVSPSGATTSTIRFDDLNIDQAPVAWCQPSAFADDFEAAERGLDWFRIDAARCNDIVQTAGALRVDQTAGAGPATCALRTVTAYDLRDDSVSMEVPAISAFPATWSIFLSVGQGAMRSALVRMFGGELCGEVDDSGTTSSTCVAYDGAIHRHVRIREASGILFFEESQNGINWTSIGTLPSPFDGDAVQVSLGSSSTSLQAPTAAAISGYNN